MQIVGTYFHTLRKRCCCCLHLQFLVSSSKWPKIPIAHLRCSMCLFMQLFWHSVSPNVTLKDNKCFCIMVDGVPSCSIGSPPSEWRQWCLKCPSNFQCNCILPLSSSSRLHPGGLPSHCGAPTHLRRSPYNPQWRPIRSSSDPPSATSALQMRQHSAQHPIQETHLK